MKTLDIEKLQTPSDEKQSGRTVRMLAEAIQHVDFVTEECTIHVLVKEPEQAEVLCKEAEWIARELGFENVKYRRLRLDVNGRMLLFHRGLAINEEVQHSRSLTFADHTVTEAQI